MAQEAKVQKKITNWLEAEGHYVVKVISATKNGVPDILCCVNGVFVGIEVKTANTRSNVSALQTHNLEEILKAGGFSMVAWELEQVKKAIQAL